MIIWLSILAALGCAVCNGVAAVLQKASADKEERVTCASAGFLWRLLKDKPFVIGSSLDAFGWILTLIAVHSLPLFVAQPIIALSVVVTFFVEKFMFHRKLGRKSVFALVVILLGLFLLASGASAETASQPSHLAKLVLVWTPLPLGVLGTLCLKSSRPYSTIALAAIAGTAFGGTAVMGRMLRFSTPYWHIIFNPLFLAIIAYGLVGIYFFSVALQRQHASIVNATMIVIETIVSIAIGLLLLGDQPKAGLWTVVSAGAFLAVLGALLITTTPYENPELSS